MPKKNKNKNKKRPQQASSHQPQQPVEEPRKPVKELVLRDVAAQKEQILIQISEFAYVRAVLILAIISSLIYVIYSLSGVLTPVLVGLALAYLINPLVDKMQDKGVRRPFAIWCLVFLLFTFLLVGGVLLIPMLTDSLNSLGAILAKVPPLLFKWVTWIEANTDIRFPHTWMEVLTRWNKEIKTYAPGVIQPVRHILEFLLISSMSIVGQAVSLLLIPLFTFYFLISFETLREKAIDYVPARMRDRLLMRLREINKIISGFIRGQLLVSLVVGSSYLILLTLLEVPLAPAIAAGGAVLNVMPYIGFLTTFVIATVATLIEFQLQWQLFVVIIGMWGIHLIDGFFITPRVVGEQVGLSEIVVIFAVMAGGHLFGIVGVLLAIPVAAVIKVALSEILEQYRKSSFFTG